jgi:hypothetical protein
MVVATVPDEVVTVEGSTLDPGNNSEVVDAKVAPAGAEAVPLYATQTSEPGSKEKETIQLAELVGRVIVELPPAVKVAEYLSVEIGAAKVLYP